MIKAPTAVRVSTLCLCGARVEPVEIELQHTGGLMQRIVMTGLPGGALRESRDRIRGCLEQLGLPVPRRSVLANFAPADLPKEGNGFDLPLAVGILALAGVVPESAFADRIVIGELALDGRLRPVRGALALALEAGRRGFGRLMLPHSNGAQASLVKGLQLEPVPDLATALAVLAGAPPPPPPQVLAGGRVLPDLADVLGQASARRALEVAAVGDHNLLLTGPPGTGKTMLAQRLPGLLPALPEQDVLEVSALHGLALGGAAAIVDRPPFRAPHHTVSRAGLVGGGTPLSPGEVSLAHRGVLFLDEVAEFPRMLLEALRQPLEDRKVIIARAGRSAEFPAAFRLVAAMNPCPCGYRGHPNRGCVCPASAVERYRLRLSGPLIDRFDLQVSVPPQPASALLSGGRGEPTTIVAARVARARTLSCDCPAQQLTASVRRRIERAAEAFALSGRALRRVTAVASSVARLDGRVEFNVEDVDEAVSLRRGLAEWHEPVQA